MMASSPGGIPATVHRHFTESSPDGEDADEPNMPTPHAPYHHRYWHFFPTYLDEAWGLFIIVNYGSLHGASRPFDR